MCMRPRTAGVGAVFAVFLLAAGSVRGEEELVQALAPALVMIRASDYQPPVPAAKPIPGLVVVLPPLWRSAELRQETAEAEKTLERLRAKVTLDLIDTPLSEVIPHLYGWVDPRVQFERYPLPGQGTRISGLAADVSALTVLALISRVTGGGHFVEGRKVRIVGPGYVGEASKSVQCTEAGLQTLRRLLDQPAEIDLSLEGVPLDEAVMGLAERCASQVRLVLDPWTVKPPYPEITLAAEGVRVCDALGIIALQANLHLAVLEDTVILTRRWQLASPRRLCGRLTGSGIDLLPSAEGEWIERGASFACADTPVCEALGALHKTYGLNVFYMPNVDRGRTVTVQLERVPLRHVVSAIVRAAGLDAAVYRHGIVVAKAGEIDSDLAVGASSAAPGFARQLAQPVTLSLADASVPDAADRLADKLRVRLLVDPMAAERRRELRVDVLAANVPGIDVLDIFLYQTRLACRRQHGALCLTSEDACVPSRPRWGHGFALSCDGLVFCDLDLVRHANEIAVVSEQGAYEARITWFDPSRKAALLRPSDEAVSSGRLFPRRTAACVLTGLLSSPDPDVQSAAARTLATLGASGELAVPRLISLLKAPQARVRDSVARALGKIGASNEAAASALTEALRDEDLGVRTQAALALGNAVPAPDDATQALTAVLADRSIGPAAARALESRLEAMAKQLEEAQARTEAGRAAMERQRKSLQRTINKLVRQLRRLKNETTDTGKEKPHVR